MKKKVKINTAAYDEIRALPYMKDPVAQKIVDDRALNGPFGSPDELIDRVKGLGDLPRMWSSYYIDWEVPVPPEPLKERRSWRILLWAVLIILLPAVVVYPPFAKLLRTLDGLRLL